MQPHHFTLAAITTELWPVLKILPPIIAIGMAIAVRDVNVSLLLAASVGCLLMTEGPIAGVERLCSTLVEQVADGDHASIILFTVLLGAMISLMNDTGGTAGVVQRLTRFASTRERGMIVTWLAGLVVFFDDYANTMLIGGSMRPLCDRLKITRAKLAFIIDSTAAPVAGLVLSTWTAYEIDQVKDGLAAAGADASRATSVFVATIPYRIYPIVALVMVGAVAISGRDFGPMLKAQLKERGASNEPLSDQQQAGSIWFAMIPVFVLVGVLVAGLGAEVAREGDWSTVGDHSIRMLMVASLLASVTALILPVAARRMSVAKASESFTRGICAMIPACIVLVLAWELGAICKALGTADYIGEAVRGHLSPALMPAIAFLTAGAVAVSVGSSFATMGVMLPMFIPVTLKILTDQSGADAVSDPIFLASVGAILAGAIFGDHCSPISDTTVLSSAAAGCDHLHHVTTQLPYALLVATMSVLLGYLPIGFGVPWWICLPLSGGACIATVCFLGRRPDESQSGSS